MLLWSCKFELVWNVNTLVWGNLIAIIYVEFERKFMTWSGLGSIIPMIIL